ncbi:choice-of-anchor D domain-containing protein [Candidatus Ferrigenium straubiae]|uniref:choice-of-anchor D domain-containing protein n=1 Tax=Candidatus Ferrigenium straubiae TaxID=2919506 RepID=UPI003F4AB8CB
MKQRKFKLKQVAVAVLFAISSPLIIDSAYAGAGWADSTNSTGAPIKVPTFYANSPSGMRPDLSPTAAPGAMVNTGTPLRKFVDGLPGLTAAGTNNLGQYIPVAVKDAASYPGSDYYEIGIVEYTEKMHSDLPKPTTLRGYVQLETAANAASSKHIALKYPNGTAIMNAQGAQIYAVDNPHYLGPLISATKDVPVRIKYSNLLPKGHFAAGKRNGDLFLPVDKTLMGAGTGPNGGTEKYTENRAIIHLHGGATPWISDGMPHQWITPAGETTSYKKGASAQNVPDMPDPGDGSQTLIWTNQQSGRLMFYHDHAAAITRINVYGGMAAGYLLSDPVESALPVPATQIPLVIQDKTFVPQDVAQQDAKWDTVHWGQPGDLWYAHVYEPNQDPNSFDGTNPPGRWDWGPWFWPVFPSAYPLPTGAYGDVTTTPEAFMDTPVVNGTAYPTLAVDPKAYRLRILAAANDRSFNLGLYVAEPLTVTVTSGGSGYSATPTVTITPAAGDTSGTTATATSTVVAGVITGITATVTGPGFTALPTVTITDPAGTGAAIMASINTEVKMIAATPPTLPLCSTVTAAVDPVTGLPSGAGTTCWPDLWPTDGRAGGVPDPLTAGPQLIQIGNEGGLLPVPVAIPSTPVGYEYNRRSATVLNVFTYGLYMGPAERADVVVDFSQYAGKTLIVYNDGPAPVPGFDPRIDYYTGNPDQTSVGGAPSTLPGYGPNTRTIMQIKVAATPPAAPYNASALSTALPTAYAASQPKPVVPQEAYNAAFGAGWANTYARIYTGATYLGNYEPLTFVTPENITYKAATAATTTAPTTTTTAPAGSTVSVWVENKAIQELFEPNYGRMNATLGIELPFSSALTQTTVPLNYIDPATETIADGETQIWKITHNGVDTHPVHFHLVNVQLINRIGWDGTVKPPSDNEVGWKETVKMNPLEDVVVAVRAKAPVLTFGVPDSHRALDPTQPLGSTMGFTQIDYTPGSPTFGMAVPNGTVTNTMTNFGWEYVWHCHILGHEENDFMRPLIFKYSALLPAAPTSLSHNANTLNWTDTTPAAAVATPGNQANEVGFRIERAAGFGAFSAIGTVPANTTSFTDTTIAPATNYSYRVVAYNAAGNSLPSNTVSLLQGPVSLLPSSLTFGTQAVGTNSAAQAATLTNPGIAALSISGISLVGANPGNFLQTNNCGTSLAAGATCAINVAFSPKSTGAKTAGLRVVDAAGTQQISLSGTGGVAVVGLTPASMTFANQTVGTSSLAQTATLANTGTAPMPITSISVVGANISNFSQTNNCGASLAVGASCAINVVFSPKAAGTMTAGLRVADAAGTQQVALNGTGIMPTATLTPASLTFAPRTVGTSSAAQALTLANPGITPMAITSISIVGANVTNFSQTNNCGASLAAGASCMVNVTFSPKGAGVKTAALRVIDAAGTQSAPLSGTGL